MTTALTMALPWLHVKGPGDRQLSPPPCTPVVRKVLKAGEIFLKKKKKSVEPEIHSTDERESTLACVGTGLALTPPPPQFQENYSRTNNTA